MAAKAKAATAPEKAATTRKYPIDRLRANCRKLFGVSGSTFAGATFGLTGAYTVEEMKTIIEAWKKKEAK